MPTPDVFSTSLIQIAAFDLTANVHGMTYRGEPLVPFFKQIDAHTVELHITEDVDKADGAGYLRMPPICVDCALQISIDYEGGKPITIDQPAGTFSFGGKGKLTFALRLTEDLSEAYCTLTLPIAIETKSRRKAEWPYQVICMTNLVRDGNGRGEDKIRALAWIEKSAARKIANADSRAH